MNNSATDEKDYPLLDSLSQVIIFADGLLEYIAEKGNYTETEVVVFALCRQLIEQVDGVFIGIDQGNLSLSRSSLRNAYETQLGLNYIWKDPAKSIQRALSYKVGAMKEEISWFNIAIADNILEPDVPRSELITKKTIIENSLNVATLLPISNEWNRAKQNLLSRQRNDDPRWYSLFRGPSSIYQLAKLLGQEDSYRLIYGGLCTTTHGTDALKNVALEEPSRKVLILPLRDEDKIQEETPIRLGRAFLLEMIGQLISNYAHEKTNEFGLLLDDFISHTAT